MSIAANTSLASLQSISRRGLIDRGAESRGAERFTDQLRIRTSGVDAEVGSLSGGNQQKVALARWLATEPAILILDEPTQGIDVGAKSEIHALMQDLAERGMAIIMISSELPEILGMSDRIAVMRHGSIAGVLSRVEATQPAILALALGDAA
jgi:rhamnose transport system ATP-binding protein